MAHLRKLLVWTAVVTTWGIAFGQSAKQPASPQPPTLMHWCAQHCSTWTLDNGPPFDKLHYGNSRSGTIVIVQSFTRESILMERTDSPPHPAGKATLTGQLSPEGNSIINGLITWTYHPCCGTGAGRFDAAWGAAINAVPGSDEERTARQWQPSQTHADTAVTQNLPSSSGKPALPAATPTQQIRPPANQTGLQSLPDVMHWCAANCATWRLDKKTPPFNEPHYGIDEFGSMSVVVKSFTQDKVLMERPDSAPYLGQATLTGQLSADGNSIVNGTITWTSHPCSPLETNGRQCGLGSSPFAAAWGPALETVPGSNAERNAREWKLPKRPGAQPLQTDASTVTRSVPARPAFQKDQQLTYWLAGDWTYAFPNRGTFNVTVRVEGSGIQFLVTQPNTLYPLGDSIFDGAYQNGRIKGSLVDTPLRQLPGGYAASRVEIQVVDGNYLSLPNGARMSIDGDRQRGANVICDPVKHAAFDEATTFAIATDSYTLGNYGNAACWLYLSAAQGHHEAQLDLALALLFGKGVRKDDKLSFEWMRQSANQHNNEAQLYLSKYYEFGTGIPADAAQARYWLERANRHEPEPELPITEQQKYAIIVNNFEQIVCTPHPGLYEERYLSHKRGGMTEGQAKEWAEQDVAESHELCDAMHAYHPPPIRHD